MKGSENRVFRFAVEKNAMDGIFRGPLESPPFQGAASQAAHQVQGVSRMLLK
jgi:hypothetical protein